MVRSLLLVGADIGDRSVWTWQWDGDESPHHHSIDRTVRDDALKRLAEALPDRLDELDSDRPSKRVIRMMEKHVPRAARTPATAAVFRCLTGELSTLKTEFELSRDLAKVFMPEQLAEDLLRFCSTEDPGLLRILPPPSAHALPWELLPIADKRLVELVDVEHVAPPLGRDGAEVRPPQPSSSGPVLQVVDPADRSRVLPSFPAAHPDGWPDAQPGRRWTPQLIADELKSEPRSALLWIGHVDSTGASAASTALQLSRESDAAGATFTQLSAEMVFQGSESGRWPAPSRVGLVACRSGADQSEIEPFGLVVAFLEAGAELVTATRWTLPTDIACWTVMGDRGDPNRDHVQFSGPFNKAAHAVDAVIRSKQPIRTLGDWQRERLGHWRESGSLADSPAIWASIANHHAPPRTVRAVAAPG